MNRSPRWFAHEYYPNRWQVCDRRSHNQPQFNGAAEYWKQKCAIWKDEDEVLEYVRRLNQAEDEKGDE